MSGTVAVLNRRGVRPAGRTVWALRLGDDPAPPLRFDGERWATVRGGEPVPDLTVEASADAWVRLLRAKDEERDEWLRHIKVAGEPERVEEFVRLFAG